MTKIYLIRHAEAEGNLYRRVHGSYDSLLTERGHKQVEALRKRFENIEIDAVYSSDLYRAKATAAAISKPKGLKIHLSRKLREIDLGIWEDRPWGEVERHERECLYLFENSPCEWVLDKAETYEQVIKRMDAKIMEIVKKHVGKSVAVFSHGCAIRSILSKYLVYPLEQLSKIYYCDNTGVALFEIEGRDVKVVYYNDNSHLGDELSYRALLSKTKETLPSRGCLWYRSADLKKEADLYRSFREDAWKSVYGEDADMPDEPFLEEAELMAAEHPMAVTYAMLGDEIIGFIQLDVTRYADQKTGYITFYYMKEDYRDLGLGVQLLGHAVSVFRNLGRKKILLRVSEKNHRALGFYKKYGFKKIGEEEGPRGKLYVMEKKI